MDASQLAVEVEVHTNETLQRHLSEQISPVDNNKERIASQIFTQQGNIQNFRCM